MDFFWIDSLPSSNPDLIGISLLTIVDRTETKKLVQRLKREFPDKPIVLGGKEATAHFMQILGDTRYPIEKIDAIDYILLKEGQRSIVPLLECVEGKRQIDEVEGVAYVRKNKVIVNPVGVPFDPNNYALPAFDLYPTIKVEGRIFCLNTVSFVQ